MDIDEDEEGNLLKEEDEESVVAVGVPFVVTASGSIVMAIEPLAGRNDDVVKERRMILTTMEVMFRILAVELDDCEDERRNIFIRCRSSLFFLHLTF